MPVYGEVQVSAEDEGEIVRGKIDVLILQGQLWVVVIEEKNKQFSVDKALPQALFYRMSNPSLSKPIYGLATNGRDSGTKNTNPEPTKISRTKSNCFVSDSKPNTSKSATNSARVLLVGYL
jgi:hypothetical protein